MDSVVSEEELRRRECSHRLISEIRERNILHWNYRAYQNMPNELLGHGHHVEEIYFKENGLKDIPDELPLRCPNLIHLYLYSNELIYLHPSIGDMKNLTTLDLSRNKLKELPPELGNASSLQSLNLSSNLLQSIPSTIGHLEKLEYLFIVGNQIQEIPTTIRNCQNLVALYAGMNEIRYVPHELSECKNLRDLYLNDNQIKSIPEILAIKLKKLEALNLNNNDLAYLPSRTFQSPAPRIFFHDNPNLHHLSFILACQINAVHPPSKISPISQSTFKFANRGCFVPVEGDAKPRGTCRLRLQNGFSYIFRFPAGIQILERGNLVPSLLELCLRVSYELLRPKEKRSIKSNSQESRIYSIIPSNSSTELEESHLPEGLKDKLRTWRALCVHCCLPLFAEMNLSLLKVTFKKELERQREEGLVSLHFCSEICRKSFKKTYKHESSRLIDF